MGRKKRIFFDLGLTLVENDAPLHYAELFAQLGHPISVEQTKTAYHLANKYFMREEPGRLGKGREHVLEDFCEKLCSCLALPHMAEPFYKKLSSAQAHPPWRCFPFTLETLRGLQEDGYQLGLISNWDPSCRRVLEETGLDQFLNPVVVSSEVGMEKPDPRIFQEALALCDQQPAHCLYVGDNYYDDGRGAEAVGMPFCILNSPGMLGIEELKAVPVAEDIRALRDMLKENHPLLRSFLED